VVKAHASYSGGPGFKYRLGYRLFKVKFFTAFMSPFRQIRGWYRTLGHDRFFHIFFNSPFTYHPSILLYIYLCKFCSVTPVTGSQSLFVKVAGLLRLQALNSSAYTLLAEIPGVARDSR
jgi:hypothetical protein